MQRGETSVVVVWDRADIVHAFFNTRDRGSRICADERGKTGALACLLTPLRSTTDRLRESARFQMLKEAV
jgi:hypothetical protein